MTDADGVDVTDAFLAGAAKTVELAKEQGCKLAVLKAKSPSCGCGLVYDGAFAGELVPGYGVAARALREAGVRVLDEVWFAACVRAGEARHPGCPPAILAETSGECPALETERLVLRPLVSDDIDDVYAYCSDPAVGPDAGWAPHRTREDSRMFVEVIASEPHVFGIFEKTGAGTGATGPCIGSIGLIRDPQRRNVDCLMLGYALARTAWGRGCMTEAADEMLRYGFEELGLGLITCTHYTFNDRSRRVIEKAGFVHEGTIHGAEATPTASCRTSNRTIFPASFGMRRRDGLTSHFEVDRGQLVDELAVDPVAHPRFRRCGQRLVEVHPAHAAVLVGLDAQRVVGRRDGQIRHVEVYMRADVAPGFSCPSTVSTSSEKMFPGPHGTMRASATPVSSSNSRSATCSRSRSPSACPPIQLHDPYVFVEHHERLGRGRVDRPDRARHMRERVALEDPRVGFQLSEDNLAIGCLLLVEGLVGAYVGGEGHGGIVQPVVLRACFMHCFFGLEFFQ